MTMMVVMNDYGEQRISPKALKEAKLEATPFDPKQMLRISHWEVQEHLIWAIVVWKDTPDGAPMRAYEQLLTTQKK